MTDALLDCVLLHSTGRLSSYDFVMPMIRRSLSFYPIAATLSVLAGSSSALAQIGQPCGRPFVPNGRVAGSTVTLPPSGARITLPAAWSWQARTGNDGSPFILVSAPAARPSSLVLLAASDEGANKTLEQHATEGANQLAGRETGRVIVSRTFSLKRDCGLQMIFRTPALEGYVVVVRTG